MLEKREWCYTQPPSTFELFCDQCDGSNTTWSEFKGRIWCFDCKIDTKGTHSVFDGPIPLEAAKLLGMSFDRINIKTGVVTEADTEFTKES